MRWRLIDPSILKTERPPVTCARSKSYCGRRNRPTAPPAPPAEAGSFIGTKQTGRSPRRMSVVGGTADMFWKMPPLPFLTRTRHCRSIALRHRFNEMLTIPRSSLSYRGGTGAGRSRQSHEKPSGVTPGRLFPFPCAKCSGCPAFRRDIMRIVRTFHAG